MCHRLKDINKATPKRRHTIAQDEARSPVGGAAIAKDTMPIPKS
jgi:hypothetical protein